MKISSCGLSDIGRIRRVNQDSFVCNEKVKLFIIADGMGGHQAGEVASRMAVDTLCQFFAQKTVSIDPETYLKQAILKANEIIYHQASLDESLKGMGTTLTCLYFFFDTVYIAHVGDSRAYLLNKNYIWQLSMDHSLQQIPITSGLAPLKNVLTRSVGYDAQVEVDVYTKKISSGEYYLLCSDGLYGSVKHSEMVKILSQDVSLKDVCRKLIDLANSRGGEDNITVMVIRIDDV
ncbi:MAG: Stp1/IreP family PP2C-type Ser/Thr phosphatase [Deltaproteobacteria bacterium]|nr:Stp1/IreP family PP2C-type Ser/Thr phosphatase [Deltaproteobacteria bacterium]